MRIAVRFATGGGSLSRRTAARERSRVGRGGCEDGFARTDRSSTVRPHRQDLILFRAARYGCVKAPMPTPRVSIAHSVHQEADQHRGDIDRSLASHLRHAVTTSKSLEIDGIASTRVSAVVSACRLVENRFPAPITLSDLSRYCGVAERTLEYGFRQVYGTTPLAFIRSQRLTRSRMALLHSRMHASISETARAYGFTHMGQFSQDYRRLFGESPSATLQRAEPASRQADRGSRRAGRDRVPADLKGKGVRVFLVAHRRWRGPFQARRQRRRTGSARATIAETLRGFPTACQRASGRARSTYPIASRQP